MIVRQLELSEYRNYETLSLSLSPGVNLLFGDNAQGKTNILEAVYECATLGSHRGSKDQEVIRFGSEEELGFSQDFPIKPLLIKPLASKFADDLSHRDFLGALMNLGIKRELLGDIFVKDKEACVFCKESIADFIIDNLIRVKHTSVKVDVTDEAPDIACHDLEDKVVQVSSQRIDAVIAKVYSLSRQEALELFREGLVYNNGRECTENARTLHPGDVISVRGKGKFEFSEELGLSKKGKLNCRVSIYR